MNPTLYENETYEDVIARENIPPNLVPHFLEAMTRAEDERKWANFRLDYYQLASGKTASRIRVKFSEKPLGKKRRKRLGIQFAVCPAAVYRGADA